MSDLFDACLEVEESSIEAGRAQGRREGRSKGVEEGLDFGIRKGFEIGSELGFYTGCIQVWQLLSQTPGSAVSDRTAKAIAAVQQQLSDMSVSPQDQNLPEVMAQLRGKVKAIAASLGLLQHYFPAAQPSQLDM